ncbi:unnamed protein product [Sphagnum troendelagicum]|uniref:Uncharacterized protein n=1 Tax=Sphagnum troendelagicum TaxID=128251 RepID=A0ABP0V2N7_9BRYO
MGSSYGLKGKGVDLSQGPPKRKRDVVHFPAAIETPFVPAKNAPSTSGWHSNVGILVPYVSATQLSSNNNYKSEDANHLTICKPPYKEHPSYSLLLQCLRICDGKFRRHFIEKMCQVAYIVPN